MTTSEYPEGVDCVWIASDRNGCLGAFVTGGSGPIPLSALNGTSFPIEDVEAAVCDLPRIAEARMLVQIKRPDDFVEIARRGFFVYDWRDVHRTALQLTHAYEQVAVPSKPITVDMLPEPLATLAAATPLRASVFVEELKLDVAAALVCHIGK